MQRIYSGRFICPSCKALYEAQEDPESSLICDDCEESLEPVKAGCRRMQQGNLPTQQNREATDAELSQS
jgi:hypothetical protein